MSNGISKTEKLWLYKLIVLDIIEYGAEVTYNWNGKKKTVVCKIKNHCAL